MSRGCRRGSILGAIFLSPVLLAAQPERAGRRDTLRADTARVYRAPEITVEEESIVTGASRGTQPIALISRERIEAANPDDLSDVIAFAPGVFIRQYGGLGGLRTVSLRGTSSQQTTLLIDGVRYQSSANGALDLSNIPAAAVERVEVSRGGNAARFGANALGGAINVVTGLPDERGFALGARAESGSFGEWNAGIDATGGNGSSSWEGMLNAAGAAGDYPFAYSEFGTTYDTRRTNADFRNLFGRASWRMQGEGFGVSAAAQGFTTERGTPGPVVQGSREQARARLDEREIFLTARLARSESDWQGSLVATGRLNGLDYRDPDARSAGPEGISSSYDRREAGLLATVRMPVGETGLVEGIGEIGFAGLRGNNLDPGAGGSVERIQGSAGITASRMFDSVAGSSQLLLDAALRFDGFSDIAPALSPSLGISWRVGETPLRLRAHGALSYRAPSFSEQYYLNYGNLDLRPERSRSVDLGATFELTPEFAAEAGAFLIDTRDLIVSVPKSPISWSALNIGRALSRGIELSAYGSLFERALDLRASYTLMRAVDMGGGETDGEDLLYAPRELFNGVWNWRFGRWSLGGSVEYVSHRFTLPLNDPGTSLPHYIVVGLSAGTRFELGGVVCRAGVEASNIFDARYQVIRNYPMPGRSFRGGIELRYRNEGE